METDVPQSIQILFLLLTFFLFGITLFAVRKLTGDRKAALRTFLMLFFWLLFLKQISGMNFFHDMTSMPPRLLIAPIPCVIAIFILAVSKRFGELLKKTPMHWLVYIQGFRVVMEIILYLLAEAGVVHHRLTFAGSNFDILAGLSAFVVGWMITHKKISKTGFIVWNIAGILLLLNIVSIAMLSTPYPFSLFKEEPVNTVVFYFPFVWLPGFVAPYALAMHIFALRKTLNQGLA